MPTWSPGWADRACGRRDPLADAASHRRLRGVLRRQPARSSVDRPHVRGRVASVDHRAIPQLDDRMGDLEEHRIVRRDDSRYAFAFDDRPQELHDRPASGGVELAGRLVGQQQARMVDQRPGDGHPLLLPAGHLVGSMVGALSQTDQVEHLFDTGASIVGLRTAET